MADLLKDRDSLKTWILIQLGAPVIKVELAEEHLATCADDAIRWFSAKKGVHGYSSLVYVSGQTEYDLPAEIDTVLDVTFPSSDSGGIIGSWVYPEGGLFGFPLSGGGYGAGSTMGGYSSYTQSLQYIEMGKRVFSGESDWRQEGRKLYIFSNARVTGPLLIEYKTGNVTVEQLSERDHQLIKKYALARAKQILGIIRRKYDSYPTAQGSVQLDGQTLYDEGAAAIEALDEEIGQAGFPMGILIG